MILLFSFIFSLENYMVLFKKNTNLSRAEALQQTEQNIYRISKYFSPSSYIESNISNGFIGKLDEETANKLKNDNQVAIVEKDQTIKIASLNIFDFEQTENVFKVQNNAPWGLSRVLGKPYLKSHEYLYNETIGQDVEVYVIDTGVHVTHKDFGGRARWGANFVNTINKDENGHGTHVAGIIGGKIYGINKNVDIVAVKVLDRMGSGMISSIMKGIDYVIKEHEEKKDFLYDIAASKFLYNSKSVNKKGLENIVKEFLEKSKLNPKTVVNMSVGGDKSQALNFAIDYASSLGIHFSIAAGNDNKNACSFSPGSSKYGIKTGASDINDKTAIFTNYGGCVDLYAPGVDILSSWNDNKSKIASGTSMAAPHTSGVMSLYLSMYHYTPKELKKIILEDSKLVVQCTDHCDKKFWPLNLFFGYEKLPLVSINNLYNDFLQNKKKSN